MGGDSSSAHCNSIDSYGLIGNMRTAALVSRCNASIDFMCYPFFDSPSIFCRILDNTKGHFAIYPMDMVSNVKQFYYPLSNILVTRYSDGGGTGQVIDLLPLSKTGQQEGRPTLIRKVEVIRGSMKFKMEFCPAPNYGAGGSAQCPLKLKIVSSHGMPCNDEFELDENQTFIFYLDESDHDCYSFEELNEMIEDTNGFWREWGHKCSYKGRWREMVIRSALALKLLTFAPSGAILAAPTFSLPGRLGGSDNWDYRFAWIRDSAFTIYAFIRIGIVDEAKAFMKWIEGVLREAHQCGEGLRIMYGIHLQEPGSKKDIMDVFEEKILEDFEGYRNSKPVRIGNAAAYQSQLDIYGELMDAIYLCDKYFVPVSFDLWRSIKAMIVEPVMANWNKTDNGIWELRGPPQHHVYSKVMCWVALDRAIRLANKHSLPGPIDRWRETRDSIMENVMQEGWSEERQSFVQYYGSDQLDAANLIMPLVFFISPTDPRMIKTIEATAKAPNQGGLTVNNMVYRFYSDDPSKEGTFSMCSFWLVEAMARAGKGNPAILGQAVEMFEELLGYANHLGLYSEGIDITGQATGNFPQAFTHFSLISAAYCLDRALG